jgi:hypothetical protein
MSSRSDGESSKLREKRGKIDKATPERQDQALSKMGGAQSSREVD